MDDEILEVYTEYRRDGSDVTPTTAGITLKNAVAPPETGEYGNQPFIIVDDRTYPDGTPIDPTAREEYFARMKARDERYSSAMNQRKGKQTA